MTPYPFSAVVGLDDLRLALLLTAVSPHVGGVLVRGEKGTAKSTVVRALAGLLPDVAVVRGCRFACDPAAPDPDCPDGPHAPDSPAVRRPSALVELPVGATEDRVVGTLDIQRALADGVKAYEPGLLAAAHRGVLYVDEVNLLPDHLVDLLLDAAAMGRAHVERDGVSVKHAARFLLVGTMNPEEGEPRPQLVDRFGLVVTVAAPRQAKDRAEVVRRRLAYEADPSAFAARFANDEGELAQRIVTARRVLPRVALPDRMLDRIARVCLAYGVDGLRADIVVARCAVALAAWSGRETVTGQDVRDAARLALPHRRRKDPLDPPGTDEQKLEDALAEAEAGDDPDDDPPGGGGPDSGPDGAGPDGAGSDRAGADGSGSDGSSHPSDISDFSERSDGGKSPQRSMAPGTASGRSDLRDKSEMSGEAERSASGATGDGDTATNGDGAERRDGGDPRAGAPAVAAGQAYRTRTLSIARRGEGGHSGRRSPAFSRRGRVVGSRVPHGKLTGAPHLPATLRAALHRGTPRGGSVVEPRDLRESVHVGREANLVLFVVDASGSMAARKRMTIVKTAVLSLLRDAYQRRDRVGMITFRGHDAEQVLPPTSSHEVGVLRLAALRTGGRTPLAAGLRTAAATIATERRRDPRRRPLLVIVTDGRATSGPDPVQVAPALAGVSTVVVDCESGPIRLGLAGRLATALDADLMPLDQLEVRRAA
ncbi:VWA domain-containing protein [Actinoplanes sp. TBRC 11911]|uniref:VWA domain-containing protein n=1 Tax=Actinoplanes sp. TBRC 11911 TaxID=2729386 RepID=UPI00145D321E|nr:VWA domain-containing protein [Actinoplanes sp. TBRC 11911]NMO55451.1 VWA domain-containing protein [Actinoplanes sp. TBRC 11911]